MRRIVTILIAGLLLILLAGWMLISAPFFGRLRADLVQSQLDKAGTGLVLSGPVSVDLGKLVHVAAEDIRFGASGEGPSLARVEADLALSDLLHGRIDPANILISGASAAILRDAQGGLTGLPGLGDGKTTATAPADPNRLLAALAGKTIRLHDSRASLHDQRSNFAFEAQLATLELTGDDGDGQTHLHGTGTLNGQPLLIEALAATDAPLSAHITSGATTLAFAGAPGSKGLEAGLHGQVSLDSTDLKQTLTILQLESVLSGKATARAILGASDNGGFALTGIDASVVLDTGPSARVSGSIGNLRQMDDANIAIDLRVYPIGKEPEPAALVKDLRLTSVHMTLSGPLQGETRRSMSILTNGFTINTAGVGPAPIQLSQISRGPGGELVVGSLAVEIGPKGAPWLTLDGRIDDLLRATGLALDARVAFPMSTILGASNKKLPVALGSVLGQFKLSGQATALALSDLQLATKDTDLWSLALSGSVDSLLPLEGINLAMDTSLQTAALLKALGKPPVDLAPLSLKVNLASTDKTGTVATKVAMQVAQSNLSVDLSANNRGKGPVVTGSITSDLIRLQDLRDALAAATDIAAEIHGKPPQSSGQKRPVTRTQHEKAQDEVQGITVGLIDKDRLLRLGEANIAIRIDKIAGKAAVKGVAADLVVGNGKARFGPLKFSYGGGHFDLEATIDTVAAPKIVHLKGSSSGWDFGEIMKAMKVKYAASGTINASFDLSGEHTSLKAFLNSLDGSATVRMKNGSIATSLLDLAGLGVVPWLFSKDRREKFATITCLRAPLEFKNGVVSTRESVIETPAVQLVGYGSVDIPRRSINFAGQPRPVGKPLTRSPWPFTLTGSLSSPKVKVKDGPSRMRRVDGANKMPAKRTLCVPDILQLK